MIKKRKTSLTLPLKRFYAIIETPVTCSVFSIYKHMYQARITKKGAHVQHFNNPKALEKEAFNQLLPVVLHPKLRVKLSRWFAFVESV